MSSFEEQNGFLLPSNLLGEIQFFRAGRSSGVSVTLARPLGVWRWGGTGGVREPCAVVGQGSTWRKEISLLERGFAGEAGLSKDWLPR